MAAGGPADHSQYSLMIPKVRGAESHSLSSKALALVSLRSVFTCSEGRDFGQSYLTSRRQGFGRESRLAVCHLTGGDREKSLGRAWGKVSGLL